MESEEQSEKPEKPEFQILNINIDFPPLSPEWSPPASAPLIWGPQKVEEVFEILPDEVKAPSAEEPENIDDPPWTPPLSKQLNIPVTKGFNMAKTEKLCYQAIEKYLLSDNEREDNGYPHYPNAGKCMAIIKTTKYYTDNPIFMQLGSRHRTCCRCRQRFQLIGQPPHFQNPIATCISHLKPTYDTIRHAILHPCCHTDPNKISSFSGCFSRSFHVFHHIYESELHRFVQCPEGNGDFRDSSIYALDCEMVYTSHGPALARLSLVDIYGIVMLDLMVKPEGEIYDANTTFSGLTIEQVLAAEETLESCRAKLFEYVSRNSILIGHSLEADLKALRIVHEKIVDTSVLFMHKKRKRGLRILAAQLLNRNIQQTAGHDSTEDARTCLMLVAHQLDVDAGRIPYRDTHFNFNNNVSYVSNGFANLAIH